MHIEVWSDVACPWCYIGKRRLEKAIAGFEHAGEVQVEWRSFQLDPTIPKDEARPTLSALAAKFGGPEQIATMTGRVSAIAAEEGLHYDFDRSVSVNTFDAHRVTHLAKAHGLGPEMTERLFRGQFMDGEALNDPETLTRLAAEVGVPAEETRRALASGEYAEAVGEDIELARAFGATGVPFFVLDRAYGISGAQPLEVFSSALTTAHEATS